MTLRATQNAIFIAQPTSSRQVYKQYSWNHCLQVMPWVPQNDILGHPSTKAFLSHMGANGLNEVKF